MNLQIVNSRERIEADPRWAPFTALKYKEATYWLLISAPIS